MITEHRINQITRQVLNEEVSQADVRGIVNDKLSSKEFEDKVKEIVAKSMTNFFKELYYKDNLWQSAIKK